MATIFSFFSGSGFLDLGFENAGFNVALVNEYHEPFLDAYKYSRAVMDYPKPEFGYYLNSIEEFVDGGKLTNELKQHVRKVQKEGELVGFIGGPPCPDFSVGGKNKGSEGDNGKLTRTYVETIIEHQPDFFLFENVKGLWRTARHREFYEEMKSKLISSGYVLTENLTNCIQFGAPQDRDRILLFGIKAEHVVGLLDIESLGRNALPKTLFDWSSHVTFTLDESLKLSSWPETAVFEEGGVRAMPVGIKPELTIQYWFEKNKVMEHPNSKHFFQPKSSKFKEIAEGDVGKKSFKRLHRWRFSPTAAYGNNEVHLHPYFARRLSAAEALAIQSLPREFVLPPTMTLSNMFKTIGNGVPYVMAHGVASTVQDFLRIVNAYKRENALLSESA
ncbi:MULTISPECIES: DNA cytosine methyltransferase [Vibrio harveyi group]|uniref:DNA cytosine methyltransferase n=1 Tax=Vibrio harveyi group TaxID=717610 RepID=UPI00112238B2|nr:MULTISPECIES: DNA cytosine methyltransferase [Vibrio harveyi group]EGQ8307665.1 DNA (cytosine-5-)-methyltransferase [Vibrio parahaemolyticus]EGR2938678.1 DNA cytosine methyltransferase [Vibrio parahaemolyticus]EGR3275142.1 DNA cytosine methyltransferase [Vibrio parahaemolyticus]EGR3309617.1 DNA cytosine methyltransferase [Vibrio parahaemolyticus]EJG0166505.1 DNA cytosine methyltransferase [Vibrio parahaemolyticus]